MYNYSRIFKNDQVTYGRPYQVKIPVELVNDAEDKFEEAENADTESPEELLAKTKSKCELLIKEAELEAERLLEKARLDAEKQAGIITEEAWQKGYATGMETAAEQNRSILEEAEQIRKKAKEEYESIMAGMEADMVELVLEVARKVVAGELATNRDVIFNIIREALRSCSDKNGAILRVSPADGDYINENKDKLLAVAEGADSLEIKKDRTLKAGDCIVETSMGTVDAGAATKLRKIEEAFKEELEGR